jgi:two-component system sensor histidine kinase YesM
MGFDRMKFFGREVKFIRSAHSLKVKTWRFFLLLLSIFCVIMFVSYSIIMARATMENALSSSELAMTGISKNIKISLDRYKEMSRLIMLNSEVVRFLRDSGKGHTYNATQVRDGIISVLNIYNNVDSVYVFRQDGEYVRTGGGVMLVSKELISTPEWNKPLYAAKGGITLMIDGGGAFRKQAGAPLITMARHIYNIDTLQINGLLVVNLSTSVLDSAIKDLGMHDRPICFLDAEGNVLWGNESLKEYFSRDYVGMGFSWKEITSGIKRQVLSAYSTPDSPIVQLSIGDVPFTAMQSWETIWIAVILIAAVGLSVFSSGAFISMNIARPIEQLTRAMTNTKANGLLQKTQLLLPDNEIRRLAETYNSMIDHINQLITELIEKEKSIQKAEMRTLHEQIKPHFLYNSLETISYMALQSNAPKVHDALETLGSFYRNFLSKGSREIPLRNEILIVRDYLALQKLRYGDIFDDEYELEESVLGTMIPKLILQPLAENSLYHGIRLKGEKGVIRIRAFEKDGAAHIAVYDSGVGMTESQIEEVLRGESADENELSGFGLKGTIDRIRYYCNYHEVIEIRSEPGEYTEIEIIIPLCDKRGEADV